MVDDTSEEFGPFETFEEAFDEMLKYLNMTEGEYNQDPMAQELIYISKRW